MLTNMERRDNMVDIYTWNDYSIATGRGHPTRKLKWCKCAFNDWEKLPLNRETIIPALVDLTLFMDKDERRDVASHLMQREDKFGIRDISVWMDDFSAQGIDFRPVIENVVEYVWTGKHHWGRLLRGKVDEAEFVQDYLFRFASVLGEFENTVDKEDYLIDTDTGASYTMSDLSRYRLSKKTANGLSFPQFVLMRSVEIGLSLDEVESLSFFGEGSSMGITADSNCIDLVGEIFRGLVNSGVEKWISILNHCYTMGHAAIYGDFDELFYIDDPKLHQPSSLAEAVFLTEVGEEIAEITTEFLEEAD